MKKPATPPEKICRQMSRTYFQSNPPDLNKTKKQKQKRGEYKQIIYISTKAIHLLVLYIGYASKSKTTTLILET